MRSWIHGLTALLAAGASLIVGGCADEGTKPETTEHSLSGRVRLEGLLTSATNEPLGIRRIDDADEVPIFLVGANGYRDSTHTHEGTFSFPGLEPGRYRVVSPIGSAVEVALPEVTLGDADAVLPDTLVLGPSGDLAAYPNPAPPEGIGLEFTAQTQQRISVEIVHTDGDVIWSFEQDLPPIFYHVHWPGTDEEGHATETGAYWAIVHVNGDESIALVFWSTDEPPSPGNCGHIEAEGLYLESNGGAIATEWDGVVDGGIEVIHGIDSDPISLRFLHADSTAFAVADTCPANHLSWEIGDASVAEATLEPGTKWTFRVRGLRPGSTTLTLLAWHEGHVHLSSLPIPLTVAAPVNPPREDRAGRSARSSSSACRSAGVDRAAR
jgi:hypothetical protein